jgi:hypothetical protein
MAQEEAADPSAGSDSSRMVVRGAIATGLLAAAGFLGLRFAKLAAPIWFLVLVAAAIVIVYQAVRRLRPPLRPRAAWRRHAADPPPDGLRNAVKRWETRLDWCHADVNAFNRKVLPSLGEIVDERLRQRHGITRDSDPARARAVVGEQLWTFLSGPVRRPPTPRELAGLIAWMERI